MTSQAMNTTLNALVDNAPFSPSTSARWINSLFFISLIFSLAAALFGIIAKQWIREYLRWNAPLASPRDNVYVRQIRHEAWESWNVEAVIVALPVFLEFAMILFLAGVTVLLWTLDDIVAVVVTVAIAAFVAIFSMFTVLPLFSRHCPYRSPTAWTCLRLIEFFRSSLPLYALRIIRAFRDIPAELDSLFPTSTSWRACDLPEAESDASEAWWARRNSVHAARWELAREMANLKSDGTYDVDVREVHFWVDRSYGRAALRCILETTTLLHALSWVSTASHDTKVRQYIDESLDTIHHSQTTVEMLRSADYYTVSYFPLANWSALLALQQNIPKNAHRILHGGESDSNVTSLRKALSITSGNGAPEAPVLTPAGVPHFNPNHSPEPLLLAMLASDLQQCVAGLQEYVAGRWNNSYIDDVDRDSRAGLVRRIYELVNVVSSFTAPSRSRDYVLLARVRLLEGLRLLIQDKAIREELWSRAPGLRLQAFRLACRVGKVVPAPDKDDFGALWDASSRFSRLTICAVFTEGSTEDEDYGYLLVHYRRTDEWQSQEDELDIVVHTASRWLRSLYSRQGRWQTIVDAGGLVVINAAAEAILSHGGRKYNTDGYDDDDADWIRRVEENLDKLYEYSPVQVRQLLHTLQRCFCMGVLDRNRGRYRQGPLRRWLHRCLEQVHKGKDACEDAECRWLAHSCDMDGNEPGSDCRELIQPLRPDEPPYVRGSANSGGRPRASTNGIGSILSLPLSFASKGLNGVRRLYASREPRTAGVDEESRAEGLEAAVGGDEGLATEVKDTQLSGVAVVGDSARDQQESGKTDRHSLPGLPFAATPPQPGSSDVGALPSSV